MGCLTTQGTPAVKGSAQNPFEMFQGLDFTIVSATTLDDGTPAGQPISQVGFVGASHMRVSVNDLGTPVLTFTVTPHPDFNWKSNVKATAAQTFPITPGLYVFDVKYTKTSDSTTLPGGNGFITVKSCATKTL